MRKRRDEGFTLIELLVVIIIIGILASIAIPVFLKQRQKAYRTNSLADMKNAATAVESYATEHGGDYSGINGATQASALLTDEGFRGNLWTSLAITADTSSYCIQGTHVHLPGQTFVYRSDAGSVQIGLTGSITC